MNIYLESAAHVIREAATLAIEFNLILLEAACECFLDARRPPAKATCVKILDWADVA